MLTNLVSVPAQHTFTFHCQQIPDPGIAVTRPGEKHRCFCPMRAQKCGKTRHRFFVSVIQKTCVKFMLKI